MTDATFDVDAIQEILEARARELAVPEADDDDGVGVEALVFEAAGERYAIDLSCLNEVRASFPITPFPSLPAPWAGIMNVRGTLYAVLDSAAYLGGGPGQQRGAVMIIRGQDHPIGLLVDRIVDVRRISAEALGSSAGGDVVAGITSDLVALIDAEAVTTDPSLIVSER